MSKCKVIYYYTQHNLRKTLFPYKATMFRLVGNFNKGEKTLKMESFPCHVNPVSGRTLTQNSNYFCMRESIQCHSRLKNGVFSCYSHQIFILTKKPSLTVYVQVFFWTGATAFAIHAGECNVTVYTTYHLQLFHTTWKHKQRKFSSGRSAVHTVVLIIRLLNYQSGAVSQFNKQAHMFAEFFLCFLSIIHTSCHSSTTKFFVCAREASKSQMQCCGQ